MTSGRRERRFAANVSILFQREPYVDRFAAARGAGFDLVESWWPAEAFAAGATVDAIVSAVHSHDLGMALLNFPAGDTTAGDRGLAGDPRRSDEFAGAIPATIALAGRLGCTRLNAPAGNAAKDTSRSSQLDLLVESVRAAADAAAPAGMTVLLEALNPVDAPRYLLPDARTALAVIERVDRPNVLLQLDLYHVVMGGEDPFAAIAAAGARIGHVQLADAPGRHEPGTGAIPFADLLDAIEDTGYRGPYGLEFFPKNGIAPDLGFLGGLAAPG